MSRLIWTLIIVANSLGPDQAQQDVRPDLDPNCLTVWWYSWKNFSKKLILKKNQQMTKKHAKITQHTKIAAIIQLFYLVWYIRNRRCRWFYKAKLDILMCLVTLNKQWWANWVAWVIHNLIIGSLHCYFLTPLQCNEMCPSRNLLSFYALYDKTCKKSHRKKS